MISPVFPQLLPLEGIIKKYGLSTRKALGQHFLLDETITDNVVKYAGDISSCNVIEIGAGPGGLTRSLLKAGAKTVTIIEKDERCIAVLHELQEVFGKDRLAVIHEDALKVNLTDIVASPRKIVANLPYNIGTMLFLNWLDDIYKYGAGAYESLTLMFQDEVAQRIVAEPSCGDYGRLSVISSFLCECRYDFQLPPSVFSPPPKVNSAVVTLTPRTKPLYPVDKQALEKILASAFGQRRKMLRSSLKTLGVKVEDMLQKTGIDGSLRAENLSVEEFCKLAKAYEGSILSK